MSPSKFVLLIAYVSSPLASSISYRYLPACARIHRSPPLTFTLAFIFPISSSSTGCPMELPSLQKSSAIAPHATSNLPRYSEYFSNGFRPFPHYNNPSSLPLKLSSLYLRHGCLLASRRSPQDVVPVLPKDEKKGTFLCFPSARTQHSCNARFPSYSVTAYSNPTDALLAKKLV